MSKCQGLDSLVDTYTIPLPERINVTYYQWSKLSDKVRVLFLVALAVGITKAYFNFLECNYMCK